MSAIDTFDNWFNNLSEKEKGEIASHVMEKYLKPIYEGANTGPFGTFNQKSSIESNDIRQTGECPLCGK